MNSWFPNSEIYYMLANGRKLRSKLAQTWIFSQLFAIRGVGVQSHFIPLTFKMQPQARSGSQFTLPHRTKQVEVKNTKPSTWNSNTLATWCKEQTHWKRPQCWERLKVGGEGDNRGWDGWKASPMWWTRVGVGDGQGSLVCCSPWGCKESNKTEELNWTDWQPINNVVIVSGEQRRDSAIHIHVSILPQAPSHPGCHVTLCRVPCAVQQVLVGYPF